MVGISPSRAVKVLDKQGVEQRERRPRIVGTDKERQLLELLREGRDRKEIAQMVELRKAFIKDYLSTRGDVKNLWEELHRSQELSKHREQLIAVLKENPSVPIKTIRRIPGNGFQWLYNHDRDWLQGVLPAIWKKTT
jgi:hypothetical protein